MPACWLKLAIMQIAGQCIRMGQTLYQELQLPCYGTTGPATT